MSLRWSSLAAFLFVATLAGCTETVGSSRLGCEDTTCAKARSAKGGEGTGEATTEDGDPYAGVARPVTPAAPGAPGAPAAPAASPAVDAPAAAPAPAPSPPAPPPPPPATTAITRKYRSGDHLYTRDPNEAPEWTNEGQPFLVFDAPQPSTQAIFRCLAGTQHFVSNDAGCEGHTSEGALGWLSSVPGGDRFELLRCRNATGSDHLLSTRQECDGAGYVIEGAVGFAQRP